MTETPESEESDDADDEAPEPEGTDEPDEPMPNVPANAAKALEEIFWKIRSSGQTRVRDVWAAVLGVNHGTPAFVSRHAEVVKLVDELHRYLTSLPPDDDLRRRHENDVPLWYEVVVNPNDWTSQIDASGQLIQESDIRLIASLGDIMVYKSPDNTFTGDEISRLKSALTDWRQMLVEVELPDDLTREIREQLDHIEWLLSRADIFGYKPALNETRSLVSMGLKALVWAPTATAVIDCVTKLTSLVTHFHGGDYGQAANMLVGAFTSMSDAFAVLGKGQKALPPGKQQELPPSQQKAIEGGQDDDQAE